MNAMRCYSIFLRALSLLLLVLQGSVLAGEENAISPPLNSIRQEQNKTITEESTIEELRLVIGLTIPQKNAFVKSGITTIGHLTDWEGKRLLRYAGIGPKGVEKLKAFFQTHGFSFYHQREDMDRGNITKETLIRDLDLGLEGGGIIKNAFRSANIKTVEDLVKKREREVTEILKNHPYFIERRHLKIFLDFMKLNQLQYDEKSEIQELTKEIAELEERLRQKRERLLLLQL